MADGQEDRDPEDLSDEASPYKLKEMREKGKLPQSKELAGAVSLMISGVALYYFAASMGHELSQFMVHLFNTDIASRIDLADPGMIKPLLFKMAKLVGFLVLPIAGIAWLVGVLSSYAQVGAVFSMEPLQFDIKRIDPISGMKKFISMRQVYDGLRLVARAFVIVGVAVFLLKDEISTAPMAMHSDPSVMLSRMADATTVIFVTLAFLVMVFACIDLWIQRWEFSKQVRLTKKEQKDEHKEHEGDPMVKARIRTVQREMARRRMMDAVKTADVVITNPTHIAIAIKYDPLGMEAPVVLAKGADFLAQKIKKMAADADVPQVENVPLARALYKSVKVGQSVPRTLFKAVAEVLAYVYRLKKSVHLSPEQFQ